MAKVLLFDIETSPILGYTWGKWEQNVIETKENWRILSFAYKWLGGKTKVFSLVDFPGYKKDKFSDKELCKKLWELFNEAEILVAHNGDQFDVKKSCTRFAAHGLTPPKPYKTVDTKKVAKRFFAFDSNSLNDLAKYFGFGSKLKHEGFPLWTACMSGDTKAWGRMKKYNKQDVELLERIYKKFLPWMNRHPSLHHDMACPKCSSDKLQSRGVMRTVAATFQRFQCQNCGGWCRGNRRVGKNETLLNI